MKFLQSLIEQKVAPVEEVVTEAKEQTYEVDSSAQRVGDFLIWVSAFRMTNDILSEVIVRVHNEANKSNYYVEFFPQEGLDVTQITPQAIQAGEVFVTSGNGRQAGAPVDEETKAFITKLVHNYLTKELDDVIANQLNPDFGAEDETYEQRREKMRQGAAARAEIESEF